MKKNINSFNVIAVLIAALFFAVMAGGCGGGSSSSSSGDGDGESNTPVTENLLPEEETAASKEKVLNVNTGSQSGMDLDGNGMPDFLDFYGIPQVHLDNSVSKASFRTASAPVSVIAAAEMNVTVPSMVWLNKLRPQSEDPTIILVTLDANTEYTFEFSKNLTDFLGGTLPNIKIYDPSNAALSLDKAQPMSDVEITPYPKEHPSIVCYTITAPVSGNYLVRIQNGEPVSNTETDLENTDGVLFIYKERRSDDGDDSEPGYYTRFKFSDESGESDVITISDIIELRKLFLEANPDYFENVYGQNSPDDYNGTASTNYKILSEDYQAYLNFLDLVQSQVGIADLESAIDPEDYMTLNEVDAALKILSDDGADALVNKYGDSFEDYEKDIDDETLTKVLLSGSGGVQTSDALDVPSSIPSSITGIPYEDRYHIGRGLMARTFLDPPGAMEVETIKDKYEQVFAKYDYDGDNTSASKDVSMHPHDDGKPLTTDSYVKFISTASQADLLSKSSANVSLATSALGISSSSGSTNNFKFGINATTLVIHREETEIGYRELSYKQTLEAWKEAGFLDMIEAEDPYKSGTNFVSEFRNDFGDYYVAAYQYGACYDAYISITTQTSEQISTLEQKLSANLNLSSITASSDMSKNTKDALNNAKATVTVRVVTNGMGQGPQEIPLPKGVSSRDVDGAIDHVFTTLADFNKSLLSSSRRSQYAPIRVKMKRWKNNLMLGLLMKRKGDKDGTIPLTIRQGNRISALNTKLKALRGYKNLVMDNQYISGTATQDIGPRFETVINTITSVSDDFYNFYKEDARIAFDSVDKEVDYLLPKFKALADRYVFHNMLVLAQQSEKKIYTELADLLKKEEEGTEAAYKIVRQMPFKGLNNEGGSSGYDEFPFSEFVTEDMNAGETVSRQYQRSGVPFTRLEWNSTRTGYGPGLDIYSYWPSAGPAILQAKTKDGSRARFCKVTVNSVGVGKDTDRHRELTSDSSPAVGKETVKFYFLSGRGNDVDWNISGKSMRMRTEDYPFLGTQLE